MQVEQTPAPFTAGLGYVVTPSGGTPPYHFLVVGSPPNPANVSITYDDMTAEVNVPAGTPSNTKVYILVSDSAEPPNTRTAVNKTY